MAGTLEITYGNTTFSGVEQLGSWTPPGGPCVYCVLMRPKPEQEPTNFKVIYFGDHEDLADRDFYGNHPKLRCWISEGGRLDQLFIGFCQLPNSSMADRKQRVLDLVDAIRPICNW